jgi:hypothetical protein
VQGTKTPLHLSVRFRIFADWCRTRGVEPIPAAPEVVSTFLASQATSGVKAATLARRVAAIRYAHAGYARRTVNADEGCHTRTGYD